MNLIALVPLLGPLLERLVSLIPDPEARAKALAQAQTEMVTTLSQADTAQAQTNTAQAQSGSFFVAGARPAFMWLCCILVAYDLALRDIINAVAIGQELGFALPPVPTEDLWTLTFGLLGLSVSRTFEKVRGVHTQSIRK